MTTATVWLHGERVGTLDDADGPTTFQLEPHYWTRADRPILSQLFEDHDKGERYRGPGLLPSFFANLMPEGAFEDWLCRKHGVDVGLPLLIAIGHDLPGAVAVVGIGSPRQRAREVVQPPPPKPFSYSLAGLQMKLPASLDKDDRLTLPLPGEASTWILKIPPTDRYKNLVDNELATMGWARAAGFAVPECQVREPPEGALDPSDVPRRSLLVRRFDRSPAGPVHQEDFCQLLGLDPDQKYPPSKGSASGRFSADSEEIRRRATTLEGIARVVKHLLHEAGAEEFVRRVVFLMASGNADFHLKNWSVIYPDRRRPAWSPLYDQVALVAWNDVAMDVPLFGNVSFAAVHVEDLVRLAAEAGLSEPRTRALLDDTLARLSTSFGTVADLYPEAHRQRLRAHWRRGCPLLAGHPLPAA